MTERLVARAREPVDAASLAAFRILFGAMMLFATLRFWAKGWIEQLYVAPSYHFTYWGFEWIEPLPGDGMYVVFALLAVSATLVMLGLFYRIAIASYFVLFTYVELLDQTTYLNHYYLISVVALLMVFLPMHRAWSLDARRRPAVERATVPRVAVWVLRLQIGLVYFFAGVAKLNPDWLFEAEPLTSWLLVRGDVPVIGSLVALPGAGHAMSWAGALFDLTIPFWLGWRRSRPFAYAAVVVFHAVTGLIFHIGVFPLVMITLTPIFFSPSWPRRLLRLREAPADAPRPAAVVPRWALGLLAAHFALQLALPLRHLAYPGDVLFTEEGMRFAWHVMIVEKSGRLELRVRDRDAGREWLVDPSEELTLQQRRMMATSPDMILRYAHHVRERYAARGRDVEVRAEAWVAMNGRRSRLLLDPDVDLSREPDGLAPRRWILR